MADALVSIALEKLSNVAQEQLSNVAWKQLALFAGAADELESLKNTFQSIQALLVDAESRQVGEESVRLWLSRLRAASYDIDDVLAEWQVISSVDDQQDESSGGSRSWTASKVCECFLYLYDSFAYAISRQKVAWSIKEIRKRLDKIAYEKSKYCFSSNVGGGHIQMPLVVRSERVTTSLVDESEMIMGRENDKETMISRLLGESSSSSSSHGQVDVVGIVGIGGLGKTTLARQTYHDRRVRDHFDVVLWVCVSDVFNVIRLIKAILEQVQKKGTSLSELQSLQDLLVESLSGKRFLLVLDDVWNDDEKKWKELGLALNNSGANGSRILVTTRSDRVAKIMKATFIHELQGLSDNVSWKLFRSKAWKEGEEYPELESVGRKIANKCKGVPLSINTIGSAMRSMRTLEDWENVLDSRIWSLPQVTNEIMPALVLTYSYLPTHLKQCFAQCSIFPKDEELCKDVLVRLWVAQGFIRSEGKKEVEDIGEEYFDELVARSLFQEVEERFDRKITCKMHDLVHDLAEFIVNDEIYTFDSNSEKSSKCPSMNGTVRHAFLSLRRTFEDIPVSFGDAKKLRTLFLNAHGWDSKADALQNAIFDLFSEARFLRALFFHHATRLPESMFKLKHLRYLNMSYSCIKQLPEAIGKMKQLMYLDLSGTHIVGLPESVIHLHNLHTLNLNRCSTLEKLPKDIGEMVGLRHLEIQETGRLKCLPGGLCKITSLRILSKFIVGDEGECGIDELQPLNSLEGSLEIENLEKLSSREEAEKAQLCKKSHLRSLAFRMSQSDGDADEERMAGVFEGLKPHTKLEKLELFGYPSSKLPSWIGEMPHLRILTLHRCPKLERLPHRLSSSRLTDLRVVYCAGIKGIESSSSLPHLEKLILSKSSEFFSSGLPDLPKLRILEIVFFGNEVLPGEGWERLPALHRLEFRHCYGLKCLPDELAQLQLLQVLAIAGLSRLKSLPETLGQLKNLKSLYILHLTSLTCLPDSIGQLKSLQCLEIHDCVALGSLPHGMQQLSLLRQLGIANCPLLSERYRREDGVDWPKISHIPNVTIDDKFRFARKQRE